MFKTPTVTITTQNGETVQAKAPYIISASRSTDIPAFYSDWFFNRLEKGYCAWRNPYNDNKMYVSFENCRGIVFWTKNPKPIIPYLHVLDDKNIKYYFQYTMNDYDKEGFEPNVGRISDRIDTFKELCDVVGPDRIIWRFDPIMVTDYMLPYDILTKIWRIGNQIRGCTNKLVFSFIDLYGKTKSNMSKFLMRYDVGRIFPDDEQRKEIVEGLVKIRNRWKLESWDIELATCAEGFDYDEFGIKHNKCIDNELFMKLSQGDDEFLEYLKNATKAAGQRKLCGCINSQDIGSYNTCKHFCVYCYANTDKECVLEKIKSHDADNECIV